MLLAWNEEEKINVKEFDDQHQELFNIANELDIAVKEGSSQKDLMAIFSRLKDSSVNHFNCEEDYMKKYEYFGFYSHKIEHDRFLRKVDEFVNKYDSKSNINSFIIFIRNWFKNHLELKDKALAKFLNEIGIK